MNYAAPGIYIEEVSTGPRPIEAVGTSTPAFLGVAPLATARLHEAVAITNWAQFLREFVPQSNAELTPLALAVSGFFDNGGQGCYVVNVGAEESLAGGVTGGRRTGIDVLEERDDVTMVAAPGFTTAESYEILLQHCWKMKNRVAILDAPGMADIQDVSQLVGGGGGSTYVGPQRGKDTGKYGAFYFPWIRVRNPLLDRMPRDRRERIVSAPPSGHVAGIYARTDATRGVHKAPANEQVLGALDVDYRVTQWEQKKLNPAGVNCIRSFPGEGIYVWGARTLDPGGEWRYINVRRLFNMIEESIARSTRWVVFEPNDRTLWKSIRRDIGAFLTRLWRDGALMGRTPEEAFFVKCDEETNPPEVIDAGQVVAKIGIAPVKPAEFVVFEIGQHAGGAEIASESAQ